MNENDFQHIDAAQAPSNPRYARESSRNLNDFDSRKNLVTKSDLSAHGKAINRAKRQANNSYPYDIIYLTPQTAKPAPNPNSPVINSNTKTIPSCNSKIPVPIKPEPVYAAPKLEEIRAVYPIGTVNHPAKNTSCSPQSVSPSESIVKTNPVQYVVANAGAKDSAQSPLYPVYLVSAPSTKPTYKAIPIYLRPPYVYPASSNSIKTKPNICHCPVITVPPPTATVPAPPLPLTTPLPIQTTPPSPPSTSTPPLPTPSPPPTSTVSSIETTMVPVTTDTETTLITTQSPSSTTEDESNIIGATVAPEISTDSPIDTLPNDTCKCDDKKRKCAFCIKKAIIFMDNKLDRKSLAMLKKELKNLDKDDDDDNDDHNDYGNDYDDDYYNDDDEKAESDNKGNANDDPLRNDENENSSPKHPVKSNGIYIENAIFKVNKPSGDQSTLLQLIDELRRQLNNTRPCEQDDEYDDYPNDGSETEPNYDDECDSDDEMVGEETAPGGTAVAAPPPDEMDLTGFGDDSSDTEPTASQQETIDSGVEQKPARGSRQWSQDAPKTARAKSGRVPTTRASLFKKRETKSPNHSKSHVNDGHSAPHESKCVREHDLLKAFKDLSETISKFQSKP